MAKAKAKRSKKTTAPLSPAKLRELTIRSDPPPSAGPGTVSDEADAVLLLNFAQPQSVQAAQQTTSATAPQPASDEDDSKSGGVQSPYTMGEKEAIVLELIEENKKPGANGKSAPCLHKRVAKTLNEANGVPSRQVTQYILPGMILFSCSRSVDLKTDDWPSRDQYSKQISQTVQSSQRG